jgi:dUTPase
VATVAVIVASTEIAVALPEETVTLAAPRSATIAKSLAISLVNAASADAQDQDPMSK